MGGWVRTPIDRFVVGEDGGGGDWAGGGSGGGRGCCGGVTLDLTGLPPTVGEMEAFSGR